MPYEEAHVDGSVERIQEQVQVLVRPEFTALNPAAERSVGLPPARPQEAFAEGGDEIVVALTSAKNSGNNASTWTAKNFDELTHLLAHVRKYEAGVGEVEFTGGAAGECIGDEHGLIRPPAINGGLANARVSSHGFYGQIGKAILSQEVSRCCAGWPGGRVHYAADPANACDCLHCVCHEPVASGACSHPTI